MKLPRHIDDAAAPSGRAARQYSRCRSVRGSLAESLEVFGIDAQVREAGSKSPESDNFSRSGRRQNHIEGLDSLANELRVVPPHASLQFREQLLGFRVDPGVNDTRHGNPAGIIVCLYTSV